MGRLPSNKNSHRYGKSYNKIIKMMSEKFKLKKTVQCGKYPWKVDTDPYEIPNGYCEIKHRNLQDTIAKENDFGFGTSAQLLPMQCYATALFVQSNGHYFIDGVDCWDEKRDARNYTGNLPVIAHPPCQLWGNMAFANYSRWGGEHNKPFNDGGCFKSALDNVNRCFGVLEHPAKTRAWQFYGLEKPSKTGWSKSGEGWVCEVWQSAYGHRANKATWLYYRGKRPPYELNWSRLKGTHQIGFQDQRGKFANKPTLSKKEANATPILFRNELLRLVVYAVA